MDYQNILIIKMSSLGDVIHTLPFAGALRQRFPKARISWLVHPQFGAFIPGPPIIDEVLYFDKAAFNKMDFKGKWRTLKNLRHTLREKHFDLVIDMQGLFKSAVMSLLTGSATRIGYGEMREGSGLVSKAIIGPHIKDHVIERYLDVARFLGADVKEVAFPMPSLQLETETVEKKLAALGLVQGTPYIVLAPGARWETKRWPAGHFAKLAQKFMDEGYSVVLCGAPDDVKLGERIRELTNYPKPLFDLIGRTSLRELGALIKGALFYVSADTGPLHIATAFKKDLVALYGPTRPDRTGPYGDAGAVILVSPEPCAGCLNKTCSHWTCMAAITPDVVFQEFQKKVGKNHD